MELPFEHQSAETYIDVNESRLYMSPEAFYYYSSLSNNVTSRNFRYRKAKRFDPYKNNIFSIGLMVLEYGLKGENIQDIYDKNKWEFKFDKL